MYSILLQMIIDNYKSIHNFSLKFFIIINVILHNDYIDYNTYTI